MLVNNEPLANNHLTAIVLFADAGVTHERVNARGKEYSMAESAVAEFVNWYNMPWE